jgi:hypothetical protein
MIQIRDGLYLIQSGWKEFLKDTVPLIIKNMRDAVGLAVRKFGKGGVFNSNTSGSMG